MALAKGDPERRQPENQGNLARAEVGTVRAVAQSAPIKSLTGQLERLHCLIAITISLTHTSKLGPVAAFGTRLRRGLTIPRPQAAAEDIARLHRWNTDLLTVFCDMKARVNSRANGSLARSSQKRHPRVLKSRSCPLRSKTDRNAALPRNGAMCHHKRTYATPYSIIGTSNE